MLAFESSCDGSDFGDGARRRVVDIEGRVSQEARRAREVRHILLGEASAQACSGDATARAEHTQRKFRLRHFEAEEENRFALFHRHEVGDIRRERRLTHRRTRRDNDELRTVESSEHRVEFDETRRHPVDFPCGAAIDEVEDVFNQIAHRFDGTGGALIVDREDLLFRARD